MHNKIIEYTSQDFEYTSQNFEYRSQDIENTSQDFEYTSQDFEYTSQDIAKVKVVLNSYILGDLCPYLLKFVDVELVVNVDVP